MAAGDGQGGLVCCSLWGRRVGHDWVTELNWTSNVSFKAWFSLFIFCLEGLSRNYPETIQKVSAWDFHAEILGKKEIYDDW